MANFCTNCGTKIRKDDNFCTNCGTRIDKSDIKQNNNLLKTVQDNIEKDKSRIAKEKEEEKKKLEMIDEIFESEEIKSEIRENNIDPLYAIFIKDNIKDELINKKGNMIEGEIRYFIKTELKKASKEQKKAKIAREEMRNKKIQKNERNHGGYCSWNCRHCCEEFIDSGGGIVGDFDSEGYVDYYCESGHSISFGSFCEDYK